MELTRQELLTEIAVLRARLAQAEETPEARPRGTAEAAVVAGPGGEKVFTPEGGDQPYRVLVENMKEGAAILTLAGDILYANHRLAEMLGLPREKLVGSTLKEYTDEADRLFFEALFASAGKEESKGEVLLRPADGSAFPAYLSFSNLGLAETPGALGLVVTDLSQQKRQEAVAADGKLSQEILLQAEQAIMVCDRSGRIIRASRGVQALCGQNPLLLPFQLAFPLRLPDNKPFLLAPLFQGDTLHNIQATYRRPDGRVVHVLVNAGPLLAEDAEIKGFVAAFTDITERIEAEAEKQELLENLQTREAELENLNEELKVQAEKLQVMNEELQVLNEELQVQTEELQVQTEELRVANQEILTVNEALRESRRDLKWAQAIAHFGNWRLDLQRGTLIWCDETYRIFGLPPGTPMNYEKFLAAVHPEDREYVERRWTAALGGEPYDIEHRIMVGDTVKWVRELAELEIDSQGHLLGGFGTVQDITERKRAEEALRLSNQRLDLLAESANRLLASEAPQEVMNTICPKVMEFLDCDVFFNFLRDDETGRLHLNAWAGIPAQEAQKIEWLEFGAAMCGGAAPEGGRIGAEDIPETPYPHTELVKSYGIRAYACQPLVAQGRVLGTLSFGSRKRRSFSEEELSLMQAVADQVAVAMERKVFTEALWNSREREKARAQEMETILEAVPVPVFMSHDPGGRSISGNAAAAKLLQLPRHANFSLAAPEGERPRYTPRKNGRKLGLKELPMQRALAGQGVQSLEYDLVLQDGSIRHVVGNAVPLLDLAGRVRGAVGAMLDLTEQQKAQEALQRARDVLEEKVQERTAILKYTVTQLQEEVQERKRAEAELSKQAALVHDLYNRAPCGYHSLDAEGWFVRINDTELGWLGYSREEVVGRRHFEDILTAESQEIFRENFPGLVAGGRVQNLEYEMIRKDGTVFPVLLSATVVTDEAGNYLMSRGTLNDITERQQAEQALRESEERLRFLANQLLSAQEQERKRLAGELHDELGHALLTLKLSLGAIARKLPPGQEEVQDLLQEQLEYISHVIEEVRRLYHDLSPGDLEDLGLTRALENLIEDFGNHQPDITWQVDFPDLSGRFSLPTQTIVYRLVQEALTNIGKHAEPTQVRIAAREEGRQVWLAIEDDGKGFDLAEVEQDPNRGLGLAAMGERLYIVGGSLEIWSRKGEGTRLTFRVPASS